MLSVCHFVLTLNFRAERKSVVWQIVDFQSVESKRAVIYPWLGSTRATDVGAGWALHYIIVYT